MPAAVYARQIGQWLGLDLPITNMLHHYLVTEKVAEFSNLEKELPVVRDDSQVSGYIRMEQKSGLIGIYEKTNAASVWDDGAPWNGERELFEPDYERIAVAGKSHGADAGIIFGRHQARCSRRHYPPAGRQHVNWPLRD